MSGMRGLWSRFGSAFERTDIAFAGAPRSDTDEDPIKPTATRYAPIREAIERRINTFLRDDLVSHLEIGFNEIFLLHYIEIAADSQGAAGLTQFLHEFSPESRVLWIRKLLGGALGRHVSVEQFLGLDREFTAEQLAETDPFEEKLNQAATPLYRVILHGRWENGPPAERESGPPAEQPAAPAANPSPPPEASQLAGPRLRLSVQDAKSPGAGAPSGRSSDPSRGVQGERAPSGRSSDPSRSNDEHEVRIIEIDRFPAVVGSSVQADVELSGYYVSARHCTLHWDGQQLWVADHSTNGTWVDGERVRRGARVALANGARLGFGRDEGEGDHDRYPAVRAHLMHTELASGAGATPVAPSRPTPVVPAACVATPAEGAALAVLEVVDAGRSPRLPVLKLPFTIGRGSAQDYVVPDDNQGVSREHLVIEEITLSGAVTLNRAADRNGTFAGSQALPERFVWRFGQEIVLGERWTDAPAVRVSLQQAGEAP